jgi:ArsR family transcriptional regulator, nickel/cobalt-responsive transcriptional repressor
MQKPPSRRKRLPLEQAMRTNGDYQRCAARLKALADPERLRIVDCLFGGPKNVTQLADELSDDVVKVSHHLGVLRHANVVQADRQGKFVVYSLDPEIAGAETTEDVKTLNLGCCRLDLPKPAKRK